MKADRESHIDPEPVNRIKDFLTGQASSSDPLFERLLRRLLRDYSNNPTNHDLVFHIANYLLTADNCLHDPLPWIVYLESITSPTDERVVCLRRKHEEQKRKYS
jgi:hypothetical protein